MLRKNLADLELSTQAGQSPDYGAAAATERCGRATSDSFNPMAHVQELQIEIQRLKEALDASERKSDRYSQMGGFDSHQSLEIDLIDVRSDNAL